jgi:lipopolysaccharide biosynthesis protein
MLKKLIRKLVIHFYQFRVLPKDLSLYLSNQVHTHFFARKKMGINNRKILVVLHAFWIPEVKYVLSVLRELSIPIELVVTSPKVVIDEVEKVLFSYSSAFEYKLIEVENLGRDVYPFLFTLKNIEVSRYDLIIKLHTKKSQGVWFRALVKSLIGSDKRLISQLNISERNPYSLFTHPLLRYPARKPPEFDILISKTESYGEICGFNTDRDWYFPAGTMFSGGPKIMSAFSEAIETLPNLDFQAEEKYSQESSAHIVERFFGLIVFAHGGELIATSLRDYFSIEALRVKLL